jgi:CheY-like chemotaxis protein
VPIIAVTAGVLHTDREQALHAGMSDFLTKPLKRASLEAALTRTRHGHGTSGRGEPHSAEPVRA